LGHPRDHQKEPVCRYGDSLKLEYLRETKRFGGTHRGQPPNPQPLGPLVTSHAAPVSEREAGALSALPTIARQPCHFFVACSWYAPRKCPGGGRFAPSATKHKRTTCCPGGCPTIPRLGPSAAYRGYCLWVQPACESNGPHGLSRPTDSVGDSFVAAATCGSLSGPQDAPATICESKRRAMGVRGVRGQHGGRHAR
jgi:hypothetical protein